MPTLAEILSKMPFPSVDADSDIWTNIFELQRKINYLEWPEWPESENPGEADNFVNTLEDQLSRHPRGVEREYRLLVLLEFYRYFYCEPKRFKFKSPAHEQQFLGENGLKDTIGKTIEGQYFRPVMLNAANHGLYAIEALNQFPRRPLLMIIEQMELFKAIFEAPVFPPDTLRPATLAEGLDLAVVRAFFAPFVLNQNALILLINYLKCLAGVAPFQTVSSKAWENCLLNGVAVAGGIGALVNVVSVQFIPRLEMPHIPVHTHPNLLTSANRAWEQVLKLIEHYDAELYHTISTCEIHIQVATSNLAAQIQGTSITLFIALIILMQATGAVWQAIDDVRVVVTGDLGDNGVIHHVNDVNIKIEVALEEMTIIGQEKRLLMLVPEENRAESLRGLETWQKTPISAFLHGGGPQTTLERQSPSVEIISYRDLTHLLLSKCLLDLPGLVKFVSGRRHLAWDAQTRYRFFQILMDTALEPIEYEQGSKDGQRTLHEAIIDEWLSRQPIFLNKQDWDEAQKMKSPFDDAERLIKEKKYEQALNVLEERVLSKSDIGYFWKNKAQKLVQQIKDEQKKLSQLREIANTALSVLSLGKALKVIGNVLQTEIPEAWKAELQKQRVEIRKRLARQRQIAVIASGVIFTLILGAILFTILGPTPLIPPSFSSVTVEPTTVQPGQTAVLSVSVINPSGLPLEFEWKAEYGHAKESEFSPNIGEYKAPNQIVEDTVILKVKSNGKEIFTSKPIKISVSTP